MPQHPGVSGAIRAAVEPARATGLAGARLVAAREAHVLVVDVARARARDTRRLERRRLEMIGGGLLEPAFCLAARAHLGQLGGDALVLAGLRQVRAQNDRGE